jgi:hypothetical protein
MAKRAEHSGWAFHQTVLWKGPRGAPRAKPRRWG